MSSPSTSASTRASSYWTDAGRGFDIGQTSNERVASEPMRSAEAGGAARTTNRRRLAGGTTLSFRCRVHPMEGAGARHRGRWRDKAKGRIVAETLVAGVTGNEVAHRHGARAHDLAGRQPMDRPTGRNGQCGLPPHPRSRSIRSQHIAHGRAAPRSVRPMMLDEMPGPGRLAVRRSNCTARSPDPLDVFGLDRVGTSPRSRVLRFRLFSRLWPSGWVGHLGFQAYQSLCPAGPVQG
jgi:hypothetical protein